MESSSDRKRSILWDNEFQGGLGKDSCTGGGGRDLYAFKTVQDSLAGSGRDVIKDFVPGQDGIDVSDIDADSTTPGQQTFRWFGKAELEIQLNDKKTLTVADVQF